MSEDCHITSASETPDRVPEGIAGTPDPAVCPGHPWKTAEEAGEFLDGMAPELDATGDAMFSPTTDLGAGSEA